MNTNSYSYSCTRLLDDTGRCRWSTNTDEPLLFVKSGSNKLDILDAEKKVLTLKKSISFGSCNLSKSLFSLFLTFYSFIMQN